MNEGFGKDVYYRKKGNSVKRSSSPSQNSAELSAPFPSDAVLSVSEVIQEVDRNLCALKAENPPRRDQAF